MGITEATLGLRSNRSKQSRRNKIFTFRGTTLFYLLSPLLSGNKCIHLVSFTLKPLQSFIQASCYKETLISPQRQHGTKLSMFETNPKLSAPVPNPTSYIPLVFYNTLLICIGPIYEMPS